MSVLPKFFVCFGVRAYSRFCAPGSLRKAQGPHWGTWDWTLVSSVQGKKPTCCTIPPAPCLRYFSVSLIIREEQV